MKTPALVVAAAALATALGLTACRTAAPAGVPAPALPTAAPQRDALTDAEIDEEVKLASTVGAQLFVQVTVQWVAARAFAEQWPREDLGRLSGPFAVQVGRTTWDVFMLVQADGPARAAFSARIESRRDGAAPQFVRHDPPLGVTGDAARLVRARAVALSEARAKVRGAVDVIVLPAFEDFPGPTVYVLASQVGRPGEVVLGPHVRVTTSEDGAAVEEIDSIDEPPHALPRPPSSESPITFKSTEADTPLETHVLASLLNRSHAILLETARGTFRIRGREVERLRVAPLPTP